MMIIRLGATCCALLASAAAFAAPMGGFDPQRLAQHTKVLGSDAFEGRGVNTPAETKTVNYIIDQFRSAGTAARRRPRERQAAAGRRRCRCCSPTSRRRAAAHARPRERTDPAADQGEQIAVRSPMNGQTSVNLADAPLLFVGYGVTAPERNWDDFKGQDVKGKLIVVLVNDPDFEGGGRRFRRQGDDLLRPLDLQI